MHLPPTVPSAAGRSRPRLAALWGLALAGLGSPAEAQWGTTESERSLFSIPRSQDDIHEVRLADEEIRAGNFASAVERLHSLLRRGRKGLHPTATGRYQGMRAAIIDRMRELPTAGVEAYEKLVMREAGDLTRTAFLGHNFEGLQTLAERFPTSAAGRRAQLRLGDLWLEAGRARLATGAFNRLLRAMPARDPHRATVQQRLEIAQTLATRRASGDRGDEILELADLQKAGFGWAAYGGGGDGSEQMTLPRKLGNDTHKFQLSAPGYGSYTPLTLHATGGLSGLYFNTGHKVIAFDPVGGHQRWLAPGPMVGSYEAEAYFDTLSPQMLLSTAVSPDIVVAALQVPNTDERRSYHQLELMYKLPSRRLFAFDRHTGKRLWAHWDYQDGPRTKSFVAHNAPAPPIIDGETVYAATNDPTGAISYYLSAYDLRTGDPKWQTLICSSQGEVNMFGNAKIEYAATPPALHQGVLYGTTNLGLCYAADATNGRVLWCTAYPVVSLPPTRLRGQAVRPVFFGNNPVVVSHGVMVCTPLDSEHVIGFDIASGKLLWQLHWRNQSKHQNALKWILGVQRDEVILSGAGVIAAKIRPVGNTPAVRQIRNPQYFSGMSSRIARGAVSDTHIVHPLPEGLSVFDKSGNAHSHPFPVQEPGNILMVDGMVVSVRANLVQVYIDQDGLMEQARAAIKNEPDNPAHYLRLATLMRGGKNASDMTGARGERTAKLLRQGIAAARRAGLGDESPVLASLTAELFKISMLRAAGEAARGSRQTALQLLTQARDESRVADNWIAAQLEILALLEDGQKRQLEELDRLAATHGEAWYRFPKLGQMKVRPYAIWRSIPFLPDKPAVVARCQLLLENHPDVQFGDMSGREFAVRIIQDLIERHGREVYAAVEVRAGRQLTDAGNDVVLLRNVDQRFPHSVAARKARGLVLDQAVLRGDLATAAAMANRAGSDLSAGMLRRLMVAAESAGNLPLAHALGSRLLASHAQDKSDFAPDGGRRFADVVRPPALPASTPTRADLPVDEWPEPIRHRAESQLDILAARVPAGYPQPTRPLLYVADGINQLLAFDVASSRNAPVFAVPARLRLHVLNSDEALRLCGDRLLVNEGEVLRALHHQTGQEIWSHPAGERRSFQVLAVQDGIVHAFSTLSDQGDGGQIVGLDALSGAQLFNHPLPASEVETVQPRAFAGDLFTLQVPPGTTRVEIHRIDGVTGRLRQRIAIPTATQDALGLKPDRSDNIRVRHVQTGLLADAERIYLCAGDSRSQPVVAAFGNDGKQQWLWQSPTPRASLKYDALHDAGLVLLEVENGRSPASRLVLIDRADGSEIRGTRLRGSARVLGQDVEPRAPDVLLLELSDDSTSLICYAVRGDGPSFRYNTNQQKVFWRHPVVGDGFLAAPVLDSSGIRMELLVLDLATRRGALPGGEKTRALPDRGTGFKVVHHDRFILCQTRDGIVVFGKKEKPK